MADENDKSTNEAENQNSSHEHVATQDAEDNAAITNQTAELAARIERTMMTNQIKLFEAFDVFMGNVIQKLEAWGVHRQSMPANSNPFTNSAQQQSIQEHHSTPEDRPSPSPSMISSGSIFCKLDRWNISYDGKDNVSDFLFKVDRMRASSPYSDTQIVNNFHVLLKDRASKWYWAYLRRHPNITFSDLRNAMKKEFGRRESDVEIYMKVLTRKQGFKESFDDFYNAIASMNDRLKEPFDDRKLIDVIRSNAKDKIGEILLAADIKSLEQLRNKAREAERFLAKRTSAPKTVHEIAAGEDQCAIIPDGDEVAAINFNRKSYSTENYICWNCDQKGHAFYYCP